MKAILKVVLGLVLITGLAGTTHANDECAAPAATCVAPAPAAAVPGCDAAGDACAPAATCAVPAPAATCDNACATASCDGSADSSCGGGLLGHCKGGLFHKMGCHNKCGGGVLRAMCCGVGAGCGLASGRCCKVRDCCGRFCWTSTWNMPPHYPYYPKYHGYHSYRPYNYVHVLKHQYEALSLGGDPRAPYQTRQFAKIYDQYAGDEYEDKEVPNTVPPLARVSKALPDLDQVVKESRTN